MIADRVIIREIRRIATDLAITVVVRVSVVETASDDFRYVDCAGSAVRATPDRGDDEKTKDINRAIGLFTCTPVSEANRDVS